jgi:hypothetical protein
MAELLNTFFAILVFAFGLFTLMAGLFTAYFGAGKSRAIGITLTVIGVIGLVLFGALTWPIVSLIAPIFNPSDVIFGLAGVLGAAVGAVIALIVFLVSIMKA